MTADQVYIKQLEKRLALAKVWIEKLKKERDCAINIIGSIQCAIDLGNKKLDKFDPS